MSKLHHRKFARTFPAYHLRAGEPTYFVEKIIATLGYDVFSREYFGLLIRLNPTLEHQTLVAFFDSFWDLSVGDQSIKTKPHTIRAGHHVQPGDFIRMSVWSGKPYASKQIIIAPDIEIVKVWDFSVSKMSDKLRFSMPNIDRISANDGLSIEDFMYWFDKPFDGQIICWDDKITY